MTASLAQHAISHLMALAERGELDPWNVKVIEVIDRFISTLSSLQNQSIQQQRETDLSQSGQAFLYASMLILLKADTLVRLEILDEEDEPELLPDDFADATEGLLNPLPPSLERKIRRRATVRPLQQRAVSLQELIDQLQRMATVLDETEPQRRRIRRPRPQSRSQATRAITQLAHHENLTEIADTLEQSLQHFASVYPEQEWISFEQLLAWQLEPDRVGGFLGLLFLTAQSRVEMVQESFYQDILIRLLPPQLEPAAT